MADLSPAAQATWDAFNVAAESVGTFDDYGYAIAAALRAAADQVVPEAGDPIYGLTPTGADRQVVRRQLLTLATELESH